MCPVFLASSPARVRPDGENHDGTGRELRDPLSISRAGGRSSVVERQLPKLYVEGSIPFARSILSSVKSGFPGQALGKHYSLTVRTQGLQLQNPVSGKLSFFARHVSRIVSGLPEASSRPSPIFMARIK